MKLQSPTVSAHPGDDQSDPAHFCDNESDHAYFGCDLLNG